MFPGDASAVGSETIFRKSLLVMQWFPMTSVIVMLSQHLDILEKANRTEYRSVIVGG